MSFRKSDFQIGIKRKQGLDATDETQNANLLSKQIADMRENVENIRAQRDGKLKQIGNLIHSSVPVAKDEVRLAVASHC